MRKQRLLICGILLILLLSVFPASHAEEAPLSVSISLSAPSVVHSGEEFTVVLRLDDFSPSCPFIMDFPKSLSLSFDTSRLELLDYQPGSSLYFFAGQLPDAEHNYMEGYLAVRDNNGVGPGTDLLTLRFRVLETAPDGACALKLSSGSLYALSVDNRPVRVYLQSATITVQDMPSSDTTLHSLRVPGYTLHPGFDPTVSSYTIHIPAYVSDIGIQYTAQEDASVSISGNPHVLREGENTLVITVTAEDGSRRSYTLVVHRAFADTGTSTRNSTSTSTTTTATHVPPGGSSASPPTSYTVLSPSSAPSSGSTKPAPSGSASAAEDGTTVLIPVPSASNIPDATGPQPAHTASSGLYWLLIPLAALLVAAYIVVMHYTDKRKPDDNNPEPPG